MNRRFVAAFAGLCGVVIGAAGASAQQYPTSAYPGYPSDGYDQGYSAPQNGAVEPVRRRYENNGRTDGVAYPAGGGRQEEAYLPPSRGAYPSSGPAANASYGSADAPQSSAYPMGSAYPGGSSPYPASGAYAQPGPAPARQAALPAAPPNDDGLRPPETVGSIPSAPPAAASSPDGAPGAPDGQANGEKQLPSKFQRTLVDFQTHEPVGTIIIDTAHTYLYLVMPKGKAMRYGIGVGREGFTWAGEQRISRMAEWPDWHPPAEMIDRQPYLPRFMAGGPSNPLGARAMYLGNTLYRIHGTNEPSTIGSYVSSGCVRLINADVEDLFQRVRVGTRVIVLGKNQTLASIR